MLTVILEEPGRLSVTDTDAPASPRAGCAIVRVHRVGVCGTDIHAFAGEQPYFTYPRVLGHELGVEVVEVADDVSNVKVGDRCAVEPYLNCGECLACRRGRGNCCEKLQCLGVHTDGGMRERIEVPAHKLHPSDKLSTDQLALVETLGIGKHAVDRADLQSDDRVAVIGMGPIGMTIVQFALLKDVPIVGVDISADRCESAGRLLGIETHVTDPAQPIEQQWRRHCGDAPTVVFDATGNPASMHQAFRLPGGSGKLVLVGPILGELSFSHPDFHKRELTLLSTRNSAGRDFRQVIDLIERGRIDVEPWITHRAPAGDWPGQFGDWLRPGSQLIKGVVSF